MDIYEIEEDHYGPRCGLCNGPGIPLGQLGSLHYFRCQACGSQFAESPVAEEVVG